MTERELVDILNQEAFDKLVREGRYGICQEDKDYEIRKALGKLFEESKS